MSNIILFDNNGFFSNHLIEGFEYDENFKPGNNKYFYFLYYDSISESSIDSEIVNNINSDIIYFVVNRRGEFLSKEAQDETTTIVNDKFGIDKSKIIYLTMNLGKKENKEVGFDSQLIECSWRVPGAIKNIDNLYFNGLSEYKKKYKFICINGTSSEWRTFITFEIFNRKLNKKSLVSMVNKCNKPLSDIGSDYSDFIGRKLNRNEFNFLKKLPIILDKTKDDLENDICTINPMLVDDEYVLKLKETYFSLITESDISPFILNNQYKITEKTYKAISFHPFIIAGGCGILKYIRSLGFHTFPELFDESYDEIYDNCERMKFIMDEVDRVCSMDDSDLHKIFISVIPKVKHNLKILKNIDTDEMILKVYNDIGRCYNE